MTRHPLDRGSLGPSWVPDNLPASDPASGAWKHPPRRAAKTATRLVIAFATVLFVAALAVVAWAIPLAAQKAAFDAYEAQQMPEGW